ncbi:hypothetical protein HDV05_002732, partial [Chytridiales sp. JEL 0842]
MKQQIAVLTISTPVLKKKPSTNSMMSRLSDLSKLGDLLKPRTSLDVPRSRISMD